MAALPDFPEETICVFTHGYVITAVETLLQNPCATNQELLRCFKQRAFDTITKDTLIRSPNHVRNGEILETEMTSDGKMHIVARHADHLTVLKHIDAETATLRDVRASPMYLSPQTPKLR